MTHNTQAGDAVERVAQALQDHIEQHHGVCLPASAWDAAAIAALSTPAVSEDAVERLALIVGDKLAGVEGMGARYKAHGDTRWPLAVEIARAALAAAPSPDTALREAGDTCPCCGALPCDWTQRPAFRDDGAALFAIGQARDYVLMAQGDEEAEVREGADLTLALIDKTIAARQATEPSEDDLWKMARALSIPEHHTTWDLLSEVEKDRHFRQAQWAYREFARQATEPSDPIDEATKRMAKIMGADFVRKGATEPSDTQQGERAALSERK
jgi:hypothetical protein